MKLSHITAEHIKQAALKIDVNGVPPNRRWSEYWIIVNDKKYQFKYLVSIANKIATGIELHSDDFQSNETYRNYVVSLGFPKIYNPRSLEFFKPDDVEYFSQVAGNRYESGNLSDEGSGKRIKETIFAKTNAWGASVNIPGFEVQDDNYWQITGWFKEYSWSRIFKEGQKDKKIFFTVGVDSKEKALIYKLDCMWGKYDPKNSLSDKQIEIFFKNISGTGADWRSIDLQSLKFYDWEKLLRVTRDFIEEYSYLYDELVDLTWGTATQPQSPQNRLTLQSFPTDGNSNPPKREFTFKGYLVDFEKQSKERKYIGNIGEQLVINYEQQKLMELGLDELAQDVEKVLDGKGYDVRSFFPDGKEKFIEVKSTTGSHLNPFAITVNEVEFSKQYKENYFLYRLFNLKKTTFTAEFFIVSGDLKESVWLEEIVFSGTIKKIEQ